MRRRRDPQALLSVLCCGDLEREHVTSCADRPRQGQDFKSQSSHFQNPQRPRGRELVVVRIKPARLVDQRILRSEDPTSTQSGEGPGNSAGHASFPALRGLHPLGPTLSPPEALAGAGAVGGLFFLRCAAQPHIANRGNILWISAVDRPTLEKVVQVVSKTSHHKLSGCRAAKRLFSLSQPK